MDNKHTIIIKLDADDISKLNESLKCLIEEISKLLKRIEILECDGMPETRE